MDALKAAVSAFPSGGKLLKLISEVPNGDILAATIASVLQEALGPSQKSNGKENAGVPPSAPLGPAADFSTACSVIEKLNFINPWGKHDVAVFNRERLVLRSPKGDISVPFSAIDKIAIFDNIPKDTKGRILLVLHLASNSQVVSGKKRLDALVLQTTADAMLDIRFPNPEGKLDGLAVVVLCQMFGAMGVPATAFCSPSADVFRTSTGMLGVPANVKANSGILYPMDDGFCFLEKPPMFIPRANLKAVEFARASGASSTFDLQLFLHDGNIVEFSSIAKEEVVALQRYVAQQGYAQGAGDEEGLGEDAGAAGGLGEEDSDSEEDSDFDPENPDSDASEGGAPGPAPKRGAAATDANPGGEDDVNDEDGEDEAESEESEVASGDSDSDVSLVSDDEISASKVRQRVTEERQANPKTKKQRTQ